MKLKFNPVNYIVKKLTIYEVNWYKNKYGYYPWEIPRC
ncbi:LsbB family leaderless bacteriocin [Enterococcus hirae]